MLSIILLYIDFSFSKNIGYLGRELSGVSALLCSVVQALKNRESLVQCDFWYGSVENVISRQLLKVLRGISLSHVRERAEVFGPRMLDGQNGALLP